MPPVPVVVLLQRGIDRMGEEVIDVSSIATVREAAGVVPRDELIEEVAHVLAVLHASKGGVLTTDAVAAVQGHGRDKRRLAPGKTERDEGLHTFCGCHWTGSCRTLRP